MHAAPYGTRLRQAGGEPEPSGTGLGTLPGGAVALPQAFGTVETLVFAVGRAINGRLGAGSVAAPALVMKKPSRSYRAARQSKTLDSGHPLLVGLTLEHAVESSPCELSAFDAGGHV